MSAPAGLCVESASSISLSVDGYGRPRLLRDNGTGNFRGPTCELVLKRVAHLPNLGWYNLLLDAPMRCYPAAPSFTPTVGVDCPFSIPSDQKTDFLRSRYADASPRGMKWRSQLLSRRSWWRDVVCGMSWSFIRPSDARVKDTSA